MQVTKSRCHCVTRLYVPVSSSNMFSLLNEAKGMSKHIHLFVEKSDRKANKIIVINVIVISYTVESDQLFY